jgi:hypothetical protein
MGGKYVPRAPRGALRPRARRERRCHPKSPHGELFRLESLAKKNEGVGNNWAKAITQRYGRS